MNDLVDFVGGFARDGASGLPASPTMSTVTRLYVFPPNNIDQPLRATVMECWNLHVEKLHKLDILTVATYNFMIRPAPPDAPRQLALLRLPTCQDRLALRVTSETPHQSYCWCMATQETMDHTHQDESRAGDPCSLDLAFLQQGASTNTI